ncbi:MAG: ABC transporter permease [Kiritimatiellia bacterium]|nr:ABC transporter permease [Kiritimatiellia bacterium]MDP6848046.1 ABC transporter permease [Kiritimatiellia bacterium]
MTRICTIAQIVWLEMLRKKDLYVLLILLGALLMVLVSLNIFGLGSVTGYIKDIGLLLTWVLGWIMAVSVTVKELPREESRRTIFPLLAKPITRFELVLGKWLGAWSIVCVATLLFYALVALVVVGMGGSLSLVALLQGYILHCGALGMISAIALVFSTRMNSDAASTLTYVLTLASFLVVPKVPELMARERGMWADGLLFLYNALPHFEIFDLRQRIVYGYGPVGLKTFVLVLLYGAIIVAVGILVSWMAYRRKRFKRGAMGQ